MLMQLRALSADQLRTIVRSAVVDAIIVLTVPLADESFVSDIRFRVPGGHWAGAYSRLRVDSIRAEAVRRGQRLACYHLARTAPVALRDLDRASVPLRPGPWAIACRINGALSAQDLAWQCGLALYETIEGVGELLQAGLCAPSPAAPANSGCGKSAGARVSGPGGPEPRTGHQPAIRFRARGRSHSADADAARARVAGTEIAGAEIAGAKIARDAAAARTGGQDRTAPGRRP